MSNSAEGNDAGPHRLFTRLGKPREIGGPEREADDIVILQESLADAIQQAKEAGLDTVWYLTNSDKDFDQDVFAKALGQQTFASMQTNPGARLDRVTLRRARERDLAEQRLTGVILALYPSPERLAQLDQLRVPHGLIVVPWVDQPDEWNTKWGAVPI